MGGVEGEVEVEDEREEEEENADFYVRENRG